MHQKTVGDPLAIWRSSVPLSTKGGVEKKEMTAYSNPLLPPKMTFWERLRFLLTGRTSAQRNVEKVLEKQNLRVVDLLKEPGGAEATKPLLPILPYHTFAGCDIRVFVIERDTRNPASREELAEIIASWMEGKDSSLRVSSLGEVQGISVEAVPPPTNKVLRSVIGRGSLLTVQFEKNLLLYLDPGYSVDLVLTTVDGGDRMMMVLPDFKITGWRWAISIDDLVSETIYDYESMEPLQWECLPPRTAALKEVADSPARS